MTQMDGLGTPELREDAAMWFALMRGPEAEAQRVEFETWLAADPAHRQAYSHISEVFSLGKGLELAVEVPDTRRPVGQPMLLAWTMGSPLLMLLLLLVSIPMLLGLTVLAMRAIGSGHPLIQAAETGRAQVAEASLTTSPGEVRAFRLADGSRLILDADSRVRVMLSAERRDLALMRGRARFVVAHEPRPFVVAAGGGSVLARGTIFDVTLRGHGASVALIEGLVDVRQPASGTAAGSSLESGEVTRLTAGHGIAIGGGKGVALQAIPVVQADWPSDLRDFRNVPLRSLLAEANRYADRPLLLAEPGLGDLRVSGIFRVREPTRLAANLAELLDLSLVHSPSGIALGRHCAAHEKNSCPSS